jgi:multidrug efflux pump
MSVSSPFIHRPIATSLLGVAVMLGGCLGYWWLPVSALPQVDFPTIQVTTQLPGANPDTIASLVTAPLERQFGQIPALQTMTSSSSFGISQVTLQFDLNRDIDGAAQDVQSAINAAASTLPRNLPYPPLYSKVNPADAPIITLALTSQTINQRTLSDLADTIMAPRLSEVTGVGRVSQYAFRPICRGLPPTASRSMTCAQPSSAPMSPARKARSTARTSPTLLPPMIRSPLPIPTRTSSWRSATARR